MVGPPLLLDYTDVFGISYTEIPSGALAEGVDDDDFHSNGDDANSPFGTAKGSQKRSGPQPCLHEDGGKYAVFEEVVVIGDEVGTAIISNICMHVWCASMVSGHLVECRLSNSNM